MFSGCPAIAPPNPLLNRNGVQRCKARATDVRYANRSPADTFGVSKLMNGSPRISPLPLKLRRTDNSKCPRAGSSGGGDQHPCRAEYISRNVLRRGRWSSARLADAATIAAKTAPTAGKCLIAIMGELILLISGKIRPRETTITLTFGDFTVGAAALTGRDCL